MKWWPWQKVVGLVGALVLVFGLPYAFIGLIALGHAPGFVHDVWRTYALGETWALWMDYRPT